jgi:hypothetical protein
LGRSAFQRDGPRYGGDGRERRPYWRRFPSSIESGQTWNVWHAVRTNKDVPMRRLFSTALVAFVSMTVPVLAQSNSPNVPVPSGQNSGAGIPGLPGSKSGPAVKPGTTTGAGQTTQQTNPTVRQQDPSKIPGLPGSKSGPAAEPPAGSTSK